MAFPERRLYKKIQLTIKLFSNNKLATKMAAFQLNPTFLRFLFKYYNTQK